MSIYIGLDIGGTKIVVASATSHGDILSRRTVVTPTCLTTGLKLIVETINEISGEDDICGIGVAVGGPIDFITGCVSPLHQQEWENVPLLNILTEAFECPVHIDVDTNIAAKAEAARRGGVDSGRILYVTVSTGLGGGFIVNGELYRGAHQSHPEIGHQSINYKCDFPENVKCSCGAVDCLEALVSGTGIKRVYGKNPEDLSDAEWTEIAYNLGQGLRNIATIYVPDIIILGGGIVYHQGEGFVEKVRNVMTDNLYLVKVPKLRISTFGYDTPLIGAIISAVEIGYADCE